MITFLFALAAPLILIPVEKILPYPYIIEELIKLIFVLYIYKKERELNQRMVILPVLSGLAFTLSESMFYLINIFAIGNLSIFPIRLLSTGILHTATIMLMYFFGRKGLVWLFLAFIFSVFIHYQYNLWAALFIVK